MPLIWRWGRCGHSCTCASHDVVLHARLLIGLTYLDAELIGDVYSRLRPREQSPGPWLLNANVAGVVLSNLLGICLFLAAILEFHLFEIASQWSQPYSRR